MPRISNEGRREDERHWCFGILRGEISIQDDAREHGLRVAEVENRKERHLASVESDLRPRTKYEGVLGGEWIKRVEHKAGDSVADADIFREA